MARAEREMRTATSSLDVYWWWDGGIDGFSEEVRRDRKN